MFLCRVRKSLKPQAFCVRYSRSCASILHKHNLCRVGRRLRKVACVTSRMLRRRRLYKKQESLGDGREE